MIAYRVGRGVIHCASGVPEQPRWFTDSRLTFQFDKKGITQVDYRNPRQYAGNNTIFVKQLRDVFRYFLEQDGLTCKPEYVNSRIWPFGIESEWRFLSRSGFQAPRSGHR